MGKTFASGSLFRFSIAVLLPLVLVGLVSCSQSEQSPLSAETITQLRDEYPAYHYTNPFVEELPAAFDEVIRSSESVIIGRSKGEITHYEVDLTPHLRPDLREKAQSPGISNREAFVVHEIEVIRLLAGEPVNKTIHLAYNRMFRDYLPDFREGMTFLAGVSEGATGNHAGRHFFSRYGMYYIVDGEYVLSVVEDEFAERMNGQPLARLIAEVERIREGN